MSFSKTGTGCAQRADPAAAGSGLAAKAFARARKDFGELSRAAFGTTGDLLANLQSLREGQANCCLRLNTRDINVIAIIELWIPIA